jgi:hypothetical protein
MCTGHGISARYEAVRCSWVPGCPQRTPVADEQAVHEIALAPPQHPTDLLTITLPLASSVLPGAGSKHKSKKRSPANLLR